MPGDEVFVLLGRVDAVVADDGLDDFDPVAMLERAKLFKLLCLFRGRGR